MDVFKVLSDLSDSWWDCLDVCYDCLQNKHNGIYLKDKGLYIRCADSYLKGGELRQIQVQNAEWHATRSKTLRDNVLKAADSIRRKMAKLASDDEVEQYVDEILSRLIVYSQLFYPDKMRGDLEKAKVFSDVCHYDENYDSLFSCLSDFKPIGEAINLSYEAETEDEWLFPEGVVMCYVYGLKKDTLYLANTIDSACLKRGIDFLEIQNRFGVSLIDKHNFSFLFERLGSPRRALDLLKQVSAENKRAKANFHKTNQCVSMPEEFNTQEAQRILKKAQEVGLIGKNGHSYEWKKSDSLFAYFAYKVSGKLDLLTEAGKIRWKDLFEWLCPTGDKFNTMSVYVSKLKKGNENEPEDYDLVLSILQ